MNVRQRRVTGTRFFQKELFFIVILMLAIVISALMMIYFKYEERVLFGELQKLQLQEDAFYIERGKLLLEQSTLATPSRLEKIAREKLGMKLLKPNDYVLIRRDETA